MADAETIQCSCTLSKQTGHTEYVDKIVCSGLNGMLTLFLFLCIVNNNRASLNRGRTIATTATVIAGIAIAGIISIYHLGGGAELI
jgi:hypothetical protein